MNWDNTPSHLDAPCGRFRGTVADLSTKQWDTPLARRLQRKAWLFAGVFDERFAAGCALVDAGIVGTAFAYVFDRGRQHLVEHKYTRPLAFAADFAPTPEARWHLGNQHRQWQWQPTETGWRCTYDGKDLQLAIHLRDDDARISALNRPLERPCQYTEKNVAMQVTADITLAGVHHRLDSAFGVFDFSLGYPPRHADWQWACLSGTLADGRRMGLNAVAQYFNGLENALWLDNAHGRRTVTPLAQVMFDYDARQILQPWHIRSSDGRVDLLFTPDGMRAENLRAGLLSSRFQQPFGRFSGHIHDDNGRHAVTGYGVVEQHRACW